MYTAKKQKSDDKQKQNWWRFIIQKNLSLMLFNDTIIFWFILVINITWVPLYFQYIYIYISKKSLFAREWFFKLLRLDYDCK